jgi:two-component system, NtrC family, sensor histidine kinase HydH
MQQFLFGFIVALLAVVPVTVFLCRKKYAAKTQRDQQLEQLSKLTGVLAHEIKNPLSTVKVNLKLVAEDLTKLEPGSQAAQRTLRKIAVIQKEADRLNNILDDFLGYIDSSKLQLQSFDINTLMSDMVDFYSPQANNHSITIHRHFYDQPLVCSVDPDMIKQVVLNLFINAQQAMADGGELMIKTDRSESNAVIQIGDTGDGIAPDKLPHIFDPYYSSRPNGQGLGLAIVRKIIQDHKGQIMVDSWQGKGTLFTIKLLLQK